MPGVGGPSLPRASLAAIGLAWSLPFLQPYHRYPLTSFYNEWAAFALGLAAATLYGNLGQPNHYAAYVTLALACAAYLYGLGRLHGAWAAAWSMFLQAPLLLIGGWFNLAFVLPQYRDFERLVFSPESAVSPPADDRLFAESISRIHREPLLTAYVELAVSYGITVSEERLREKLDLNTRSMRFAPVDVVAYRQALLLALAGDAAAVRRQLEWSMRAYPAELPRMIAELGELARRRPGEYTPLLELAAARNAEFRARAVTR